LARTVRTPLQTGNDCVGVEITLNRRSLASLLFLSPALCLLFVFALTLSCLIPRAAVERRCRESAAAMLPRGGFPRVFDLPSKAFQLDNYADAVMLNVTYEVDARHPLRAALADSMRETSLDSTTWLPLGPLASSLPSRGWSYARYWHGYLVYLRPLLTLFDRRQILLIFGVILGLLTGLLACTLWRNDAPLAAVILLSVLLTNVVTVVHCLHHVQTYALGMAVSLFVARTGRRSDAFQLATFSVAGALTVFFDLVSTPMITLGVPLVVLVHGLSARGRLTAFHEGPWLVFGCGAAWLFNYVAFWWAKWILATVLLGQDVIANGITQLLMWEGTQGTNVSQMLDSLVGFAVPKRLSAPLLNVAALLEWDNPQRLVLNVALHGLVLAGAGLLALRFRKSRVDRRFVGLLLIIAAGPYLWFAAAAQHSNRHYWFTYRNQLVTMIALGCAWWHLVAWDAVQAALWGKRGRVRGRAAKVAGLSLPT
jgi:hypothetical protein